ncbi:hypothetical protein [Winogradskyella sp. A3E31]|uniref:hypothetical protein n=1 Tax=Winogradskyella sp. A3E31 TaxID=3349637 RepID=UPI00398AB0EF
MAQDLRHLFKDNTSQENETMPDGHEVRFLKKLDEALPKTEEQSSFGWWKVAASVVILLGLGYGAYNYIGTTPVEEDAIEIVSESQLKTMGDVSPDLKKVEDYYLASINLELSKVQVTEDNKEVFDGYVLRLEELQNEYNNLNVELTDNGPNPLTIDALINNLKLRLNLLYDLQEQLKNLNNEDALMQTSV